VSDIDSTSRPGEEGLLPPSIAPETARLGVRQVSGVNGASTKTVATVRGHTAITDEADGTDDGPTPLETVLIGLVGCEGVIVNRVADAMSFAYSGVEITAEGEVDKRGSRGVAGVRPHFNWVDLRIRITSDEPLDRLHILQKNVEYRCPVLNLMRDAGVEVRARWSIRRETGT